MSALTFGKHAKAAPAIRQLYNVGCLMDVTSGSYVRGIRGESILNGGLARLTGVGGLPNTYKSTVADYLNLALLDRYAHSASISLDSEMSKTEARQLQLAQRFENLKDGEFLDEERLVVTDTAVQSLDLWFEDIKKYSADKVKMKAADLYATLPMLTRKGKAIKAMRPSSAIVDSLSRATISAVDALLGKNAVGDSGNNIEALRNNHAKNQFLIQLPTLAEQSNLSFIMTAHVDDNLQLDPYAPPKTKLAFLGNKLKFKYVPNQFYFLTNNLWYCYSAKPLVAGSGKDRTPQYPEDPNSSNVDLMEITIQNLRGKYGVSGIPITLLASQTDGILAGLSEFHFLRNNKGHDKRYAMGYGISGNDRSYQLDLLPDVNLSRTTVRRKIDADKKLKRALEITSEMLQVFQLHPIDSKYYIEPAQMYSILKEKGYDWDQLLETRGYWVHVEDEIQEQLPYLSTLDLLKMVQDDYVPFWMDKDKKNIWEKVRGKLPLDGKLVSPQEYLSATK